MRPITTFLRLSFDMSAYTLRSRVEKLNIGYMEIYLRRGTAPRTWISPLDGKNTSVEKATMDYFKSDGWRGFSGEGGLILNLIKVMSFKDPPATYRTAFIEALYAQNVSYDEDRYTLDFLLGNVLVADKDWITKNFDLMATNNPITEGYGYTSTTSMLDLFPGLEKWMFTELLEVAGNRLIHRIAEKFGVSPYEYRRGWPDITMWKENDLKFVEVKAPGDQLKDSQQKLISDLALPLGLNFFVASVRAKI